MEHRGLEGGTGEPLSLEARAALEIERDIFDYRRLATRAAGGTLREEPFWSWNRNPMEPHRDCVFELAIPEGEVEQALDGLVARIAAGTVPGLLVTTPHTRPASLERLLPERGFEPAGAQTGMWRLLDPGSTGEPDPRFRRIEDARGIEAWVATSNRGFGRNLGPGLFRRLLGEGPRSFYGLFEGEELVTTLFRHVRGDVVGLHSIATPPEFRGRGYATAVTRSAMAVSAAEGQTLVVLQASELGQPVYERLGFLAAGELRRWKHSGTN